MPIPRLRQFLVSSAPPPNVQDLSAIAHVIGPSSAGLINVPARINSYSDLAAFGFGPGPEWVAEILSAGGSPVFFTRSATTTPGSVTNQVTRLGGSGLAENVYGAIHLPGDGGAQNGDLLFRALVEGVTLTVVVGGALAYAAVGKDITLTVTNATTGAQVVAQALGAAAGLIAQPVNSGTSNGSATCGQALAKTSFDRGTVIYTAKGPGAYLVPGADANGGVIWLAKQTGVTVEAVIAGNNTVLNVTRQGSKILINYGTDGAGTNTTTAKAVADLIAKDAYVSELVSAIATGTGLSLAGAIAATALNLVRIAHVIPAANTALSVALADRTVTVTLATNADGDVTSTGTTVNAAIAASANASAVLSQVRLGDGVGLAGPQAAMELDWGGNGAMTVSGVPNDAYRVRVKIVRAGTVGVTPYPTLQWSVDYLAGSSTTPNLSNVILIPATGIVALKDSVLDTGLTVTFTGALAEGEIYAFDTTAPVSGTTDQMSAIDAAIAETRFVWGFLTGPDPVTRAEAALIHTKCATAFDSGIRHIRAQFSVRDIGDGVAGESTVQYQAAISADFLGYVSDRGRVAMCAGSVLHISPYTLRQYRRVTSIVAAARKSYIPVHENLGRVDTGPLKNVLHLFYDEQKTPGLFDERFIVPLTYPQRIGSFYLAGAPTMADAVSQADAGYTLCERVSLALQVARIASVLGFRYLNDTLESQSKADPRRGAVPGSIGLQEKGAIESYIGKGIADFLYQPKTDSRTSASPMPPGVQHCEVSVSNNFAVDRTLYMTTRHYPKGLAQYIEQKITTVLPE